MHLPESLKAFWQFITTPGTEMPLSVTIGMLVVITLFTFLVPQFVQWRYYRRQNPMQNPKDAAKAKAEAITGSSSRSGSKKKNKKKKKR